MKEKRKLLAACKDMGGANILFLLVKALRKDFDVTLVGFETSERFFSSKEIKFSTPTQLGLNALDSEDMGKLLDEKKPELVLLGTSWKDSIEKHLVVAARERGIKTVAFLDF